VHTKRDPSQECGSIRNGLLSVDVLNEFSAMKNDGILLIDLPHELSRRGGQT